MQNDFINLSSLNYEKNFKLTVLIFKDFYKKIWKCYKIQTLEII